MAIYLPTNHLPVAIYLPTDHLPVATYLPTYRPPTCGYLPTYQPPTCGYLPTYRPPTCGYLPTHQPPTCGYLPTYRPPTCGYLSTYPPPNRPPTTVMSLLQKPPVDMAEIKKSRSCFMEKLTTAAAKVNSVKSDDPADIRLIDPRELEKILSSLEKTEAGFEQSFEEALEFVPEGDGEDAFYEDEDAAQTHFDNAITAVKDQAAYLLGLHEVWATVTDLSKDIRTLENLLAAGENCTTFNLHMEKTIERLREQYNELTLSDHHSVKEELEVCCLRLGTLRLQATAAISPTSSSSTPSATPPTYQPDFKSSTPEATQLVATQPYNLSDCSITSKSSPTEADLLVAGSRVFCSTTSKSSPTEADLLVAGSQDSCSTTSKSSPTEADLLVASSQDSCSTTSKSSPTEADLLLAGSQDPCSTTSKSSPTEAELLVAGSQVSCSTISKPSIPEEALQSAQSSAAYFSKTSPPSSFATIQDIRASCTTTVDKAFDQLKAIRDNTPEEISLITIEDVDGILNSVSTLENIFLQAMEDAQHFIPEEDEDNFYLREAIIEDSFHRTVYETRDLGNRLLSLKATSNDLSNFHSDLEAVQATFDSSSTTKRVSDTKELTILFSSLTEKWHIARDTFLSHPLQPEFDSCTRTLGTLRYSIYRPKEPTQKSTSLCPAPVPPPTITDTTDCHPEVVAVPNTEQSPCQQRSHAFSTTPLQSILGPPPRIPSSKSSIHGQGTQSLKSTFSTQPTSAPEKKPPAESQDTTSHHKPQKSQVDSVSATTPAPLTNSYKWDCLLCPKEKHPLHICPAWATLTIPQRINHITLKKLCFNCLAKGHTTSTCRSRNTCKICQQLHHTTIHITPASKPEAQGPPPQRLLVCQPHLTSPATTSHNLETDSRSANLAEESDLPLHPTEVQNNHCCSDPTSLLTSLLPSKDSGTQHTHPEEETTSSLKDCDQLQSTHSLCSSAKDEDISTTSINLPQSTDNICPSNNSASQTESKQPPQQELLPLHHPRSLTDGYTAPADLLFTSTQQLLPASKNNILEKFTATLQPPHHSMSLTDGYTATTGLTTSATSAHHILGEDILPQAPSAECQTPQQIHSPQATSAECQTPQQIHLPQATEALQQDLKKKHSREDALSLLHSDHSKQHHTPSLLTEKMDTAYLTRLLLYEHPQLTYKSLLINNLMLMNSVSINPATLHYWIDSSIYISWLHDRKQQVSVVTNYSISLLQAPRSITWNPRPTASIHKQPSEHGLLEEQSIIVFPSPPTTAENYCKQSLSILDNPTPEVSISNLSGSHSPTQPVQTTTRSIGTLIIRRLCVFLLMCLHFIQQLYPCYSFIKLDEHYPPNHCKRLQSRLASHPWPTALLQAVLLFTFNSHSRPLHRHQVISDATNHLHLTLEHSNSTVSYDTDPNLLLLSARRLSRSIYFYQRWGILPHLHHLANGAFFSYLTDFTSTNTVLHGFSIWNNFRQCSKTLAVENISYSYHWPLIKTATTTFKQPTNKLAPLHREEGLMATPGALPPGACSDTEDRSLNFYGSQTTNSVPELTRHLPEAECQKLLPPSSTKPINTYLQITITITMYGHLPLFPCTLPLKSYSCSSSPTALMPFPLIHIYPVSYSSSSFTIRLDRR